MENEELRVSLDKFRDENGIAKSKGKLSAIIQLTRAFSENGIPVDPDDYRTSKEGQVKGLGGGNIKKILAEHGITRTLSREGGRTSRGVMGLMSGYAAFVNGLSRPVDFNAIEGYWVEQVRGFFTAKPFKLDTDSSKSIANTVDDLLSQAMKRQAENPGTTYAGTVLQHLIAAKLCIILDGDVELNGADVADAPTGRGGDFMVGDTAIHATTAPGQPLIEKCGLNIQAGIRPVIITVRDRVRTARDLAEDAGIADRVEVWDIQQFLSTNIYEHGLFDRDERRSTIGKIIDEYNDIVDKFESDPSLKIDVG